MLDYLYIVFIAIAFLSSLYSYRLGIFHYKVISVMMAIDLVLEIWANIKRAHLANNIPIYNFAMLAEFWVYGYYFSLITRYRRLRRIIRVYLVVLPVIWIVLVIFLMGIWKWDSHFLVIGSLATVLLSANYYYELFTADELVKLSTSFEFWIATALIIFYACNLPYLGILQLLTKNLTPLATRLIQSLQIFNILFYSMITYAYLCRIRIAKS